MRASAVTSMSVLVAGLACTVGVTAPSAPAPGSVPAAAPGPVGSASPGRGPVCLAYMTVAWAGAEGADSAVTRGEDAARSRAEALRARIADGESFASLSAENDQPPAPMQAALMGRIVGQILALEPGTVAPVIRTEFGYVIAQRCPLEAAEPGTVAG